MGLGLYCSVQAIRRIYLQHHQLSMLFDAPDGNLFLLDQRSDAV